MNIEPYLYQMERNGLALTWLVRDMPDELAKWRPDQDSWSVVEVMYHLIDEEREDFRQRLNYLLNMPGEQFPPIDPQNWPEERKYNERDLLTAIKTFINERAKSINWLRNLQTPNWENTTEHPVMGPMTATDMFAAWLRHDHLHLRQLNEIMMAWGEKEFEGRRYQYAGE